MTLLHIDTSSKNVIKNNGNPYDCKINITGRYENVISAELVSLEISYFPQSLFSKLSSSAISSAISAFSLRAVNGQTALAVNVRNGTTSATQDFYADVFGNLLTYPVTGQSLSSWLGGATGYVATWYDQSGKGNDATQTTPASQPQIQKGTKGPGYMILFTGSQYLTGFTSDKLNKTNFTVCMNERRTSAYGNGSTDNPIITCGLGGAINRYLHNIYRTDTTYLNGVFGSQDVSGTISAFVANEPIRYGFTLRSAISGANIYVYGDPLGTPIKVQNTLRTVLLSNMSSNRNLILGGLNYNYDIPIPPSTYYIGEMYEILIFKSSFYDTDGTTGTNVPTTVQTIYNDQLSYTGR